jgi:hypothetical protein
MAPPSRLRMFLFALWALCWALFAHESDAATVFVAPSGDDAAAGTLENPWRTIQQAVNRTGPGDTIVVQPGLYRESVVILSGGTAELPLEIIASPGAVLESPNPELSLSAFDIRNGAGHLRIDGFEIRGGFHESVFLRPGAHHIVLRNLHIHRNRVGIWIAGAHAILVQSSVVEANSVHGIRVYQGSREVEFEDTDSIANDDGEACNGEADGFIADQDVSGFRCRRCRAIANGEDGFDLAARDVFLDRTWATDNGCAGMKLYQGGRLTNSVVARNRTGVVATNVSADSVSLELLHATLAENRGTQLLLRSPMEGFSTTPYAASIRNSILSGPGKLAEIESGVTFFEERNLFFRPDSTADAIVFRQKSGTRVFRGQDINSGNYQAQTGTGAGSLAVDPEFADVSTYTPSPTSPAVDRGSLLPLSSDVSGAPRSFGFAPDIGAHETPFTATNHRPWPDPGPNREVIVGTWFGVSAYGSVDPNGDPLTYRWDFGDGTPSANGFTARHLYLEPGSYLLSLTASDQQSSRTRTATVSVVWPPSSHLAHDTAIVLPPAQRVVIAKGSQENFRWLRLRVRNADTDATAEPRGHLAELLVTDGTCPPGTVASAPDFERSLWGDQNRALIAAGRTRTARVLLRFTRAAAPGCAIAVAAHTVAPGNSEPTPADNMGSISFTVIDRN